MYDQSAYSQGHQHLSRLTLHRPRASALPKSPCASLLRLLLQTQMTHTPQGKEHRFLRQHTRQPFLQKDFLPCRQDASIFVKEGIAFARKKIRPLISAYLRRACAQAGNKGRIITIGQRLAPTFCVSRSPAKPVVRERRAACLQVTRRGLERLVTFPPEAVRARADLNPMLITRTYSTSVCQLVLIQDGHEEA